MPRKPIPPNATSPYHITARSINRDAFPIDLNSMWSVCEDYLYLVKHLYELQIHSFVLMPNHFHLLTTAPNANVSEAMNYFMRETSREVSRLSGRINQTYGVRHHKSLVLSRHYFFNAYKYVYRNPVRAGLAKRVEDYRYSTLSGLLGKNLLLIPLAEDSIIFPNDGFASNELAWLNADPNLDEEDEVRRALKRPEFRFTKVAKYVSRLEAYRL